MGGLGTAGDVRNLRRSARSLLQLVFLILICGVPFLAQSPQSPVPPPANAQDPADQHSPGSLSGTVVDNTGAVVAGARVQLAHGGHSPTQETLSNSSGQFFFPSAAPGLFELTVTAPTFAAQTFAGTLGAGQVFNVPQITLAIATTKTDVQVQETRAEVAEDEVKVEEQQRVLAVFPNYYVSYVPDAVPLPPKLKFQLAWKTLVDPVSFGITGVIAGVEQAADDFNGYGQGAAGFGRRYGAAYGDFVIGTMLSSAVLPALLKQDPRYFYKGTGSKRSRILYAIANSVICKGDNGRWQVNYSGILGGLAAGGISNLYYPAQDRDGAGLTFENAGIGIGAGAAANIIQEFVVKKLTPHARGAGSRRGSGDDAQATR